MPKTDEENSQYLKGLERVEEELQEKVVLDKANLVLKLLQEAGYSGVTDLEFKRRGILNYNDYLEDLKKEGWKISVILISGKKGNLRLYLLGPSRERISTLRDYADKHEYEPV